jgi:uncharacterized membrane protein YfcA
MDIPELLTPVLAIAFLAGLIQGLAGFGCALIASAITVIAHWASGLVTDRVLHRFLWSTPLLLAGTLGGARIYRRLGEHNDRRLTFGLILATGVLLITRSIHQTF